MAGREAAKKMWAEDIKVHYMDAQHWTAAPPYKDAMTTDDTSIQADESDVEDADETEETSASYKAFIGFDSDN